MYSYNILKDGFKIGVAKGKHKAFEFVQAILKRDNMLGIWDGIRCETDVNVYSIERANEKE